LRLLLLLLLPLLFRCIRTLSIQKHSETVPFLISELVLHRSVLDQSNRLALYYYFILQPIRGHSPGSNLEQSIFERRNKPKQTSSAGFKLLNKTEAEEHRSLN
jgi:hypothetical protein